MNEERPSEMRVFLFGGKVLILLLLYNFDFQKNG